MSPPLCLSGLLTGGFCFHFHIVKGDGVSSFLCIICSSLLKAEADEYFLWQCKLGLVLCQAVCEDYISPSPCLDFCIPPERMNVHKVKVKWNRVCLSYFISCSKAFPILTCVWILSRGGFSGLLLALSSWVLHAPGCSFYSPGSWTKTVLGLVGC